MICNSISSIHLSSLMELLPQNGKTKYKIHKDMPNVLTHNIVFTEVDMERELLLHWGSERWERVTDYPT